MTAGTHRASGLLHQLYWDPVRFSRDILGIDPWEGQELMMLAPIHHDRVTCRSGHKIGKSTTAACLALWFAATRRNARVIMTAPTHRQVDEVLWREVKRLHRSAKVPFGGRLYETPGAGLSLRHGDDDRQVMGFSTDHPDRFSGISGENVIYIVDEASGVPKAIFEAIEGNRAGGAKLVLFGNPTQTSGTFYESHNTARDWYRMHISSEYAAEWQDKHRRIPGLATGTWVKEKLGDWGRDSPIFDVRVKGVFPSGGSQNIVPLALVEQAEEREVAPPIDAPLEVGVDPARYGDDETVIQMVRGKHMYPPISLRHQDTVEIADIVAETVRAMQTPAERATTSKRPEVRVDVIGIGAGVRDQLYHKHSKALDVQAITSSEKANDDRRYFNVRTEMAFAVRDWFRDGGMLHKHDLLRQDLLAYQFTYDTRNRFKALSKDDMKEQLGRSPDYGDALGLAVYRRANRIGRANVAGL